MRAYYFDNLPGDQRAPHDSGKPVDKAILESFGVLHWRLPVPSDGRYTAIDAIAQERNYKNRDFIAITKEGLGDSYESKIKMFYEEHMHEDEEIRYILEGSGYFDVRDHPSDTWIRCAVDAGDLIVLPAGIYHRFTLDEVNTIRVMRLFKDEPKWTPHNRGEVTDSNPYRLDYLKSIAVN
ncbi:hypothetical protein ID866_6992 [Astraeus odoratus]|nr:hypothetical protein ID866_6992 [Astraeus odoratus]